MAETIKTTVGVIEYLGGNKAVAQLLGTTAKAVANWRYSGQFPAHTYLILKEQLRAKDKAAPDALWAMTARRK